jgi:hypothetical protein
MGAGSSLAADFPISLGCDFTGIGIKPAFCNTRPEPGLSLK